MHVNLGDTMPSNPADKANRIFREQKGSCSQAIFAAYGEHLGFGKVEFETGLKIASAFSGGIARTGNVCGALTGALLVLHISIQQPLSQEIPKKYLNRSYLNIVQSAGLLGKAVT